MKKKYANILIFSVIFLLTALITAKAQPTRGVGVKVKSGSGEVRQIELYKGSFALVIGNSRYTNGWDSLPGVSSDVAAVREILQKQGFTVETAENLTGDEFTQRINKFINDYGFESENRLLIYYAGHGHTLGSTGDQRDLGYIVPVDAPLPKQDEIGFKRRAITMDTIQNFAKRIEAKHALFLFDSCFSGKLVSRNTITIPPVIEEKVALPVRQFITAGAADQPVPDESYFRRSFVHALEGDADRNSDGYLTGTELAEYLKEKVTNYSNRTQTPQYGKINDPNLDRGDFIFVTGTGTNGGGKPDTAPPSSVEKSFWQAIENSSDARDFKSYLARTESGEFTGAYKALAELKLGRLLKAEGLKRWSGLKVSAAGLLKYASVYSPSKEGLALVVHGQWGESEWYWAYIDQSGREMIKIEGKGVTNGAGSFSEGLAAVGRGGEKWGYINQFGRQAIQPKYDMAMPFSEGLAGVRIGGEKGGKYAYIDRNGYEVIPPTYNSSESFSDGLAVFRDDEVGKHGYMDKTGKTVIAPQYIYASTFSEGLAAVLIGDFKTGKWGFIDKTGHVVIQPKYDWVKNFSEGLAPYRVGDWQTGKWGFIDKTGRVVIQPKYDDAEAFSNGIAWVKKDGRLGAMDKTGREVIPVKYEIPREYSEIWCRLFEREGIYGLTLDGRKGFVDIYGNEYFDF